MIRKPYKEVYEKLLDNKNEKVSKVLPEIEILIKSRQVAQIRMHIRDGNKKVVAVHDSYFKRWMPLVGPDAVQFGKRNLSNTGLTPMCLDATREYSRKLAKAKTAATDLLGAVRKGDCLPEDIPDRQSQIEWEKNQRSTTDKGFKTKEEVIEYLKVNGVII